MPSRSLLASALVVASLFICSSAAAQQAPDRQPTADSTPKSPELDQTVINVPTTLALKRHHSYFRLTHRFTGDLGSGDLGQLAGSLFTLDDGAIIGLEYRFGITDNIQAGVHRTILGKTINVFGKWDVWQQASGKPFGLSVLPSIEGQNNLRVDPQPGIAATVSRSLGSMLVVYASPAYVHNAHTATLQAEHEGHEHEGGVEDADSTATDTTFIGLGARLRFRPSVAVVAEISPRISGYQPGDAAYNFGIEKLTHGHVLQLNFGNNFDSTPGMIARGGNPGQVYMGFNLSRKW